MHVVSLGVAVDRGIAHMVGDGVEVSRLGGLKGQRISCHGRDAVETCFFTF